MFSFGTASFNKLPVYPWLKGTTVSVGVVIGTIALKSATARHISANAFFICQHSLYNIFILLLLLSCS